MPITSKYRGLDILEMPPNTQGLTALVLLNILERFDLAALDPLGPEHFHFALEAARLAFALRDAHLADPLPCEHQSCKLCSTSILRASLPAALTSSAKLPDERRVRRQRYGLSQRRRP